MNPENHKKSDDDEGVRKLPEFIYIEEEHKHYEPQQEIPFRQENMELPFGVGVGNAESMKLPFHLHLFCGLASIITLFWMVGVFLFFTVSAVIAACGLFKNSTLNSLVSGYWKTFKRATVITTGLIIGIFSPYLGFVLVLSYLLLQGEQAQQGFVARILQSQFHPYMHR
jgi:hypothetical protein